VNFTTLEQCLLSALSLSAQRSYCRIDLFWIKAPRKRGAPCALGAALLAALASRHRARRRAAPAADLPEMENIATDLWPLTAARTRPIIVA
jgi:hypothetical protein